MRSVLRSKIHKATVTEANAANIGNIIIDSDLLDRAGIWPNERIMIVSNRAGARFETYVVDGQRGSGIVSLNGAAAHIINQGEVVDILAFELTDKPLEVKHLLVDGNNRFTKFL